MEYKSCFSMYQCIADAPGMEGKYMALISLDCAAYGMSNHPQSRRCLYCLYSQD